MEWSGNDGRVTTDPGIVEMESCGVCGAQMSVKRNVMGPTGFMEAMGKGKHLHDVFTCLDRGTAWHQRIVALKNEAINLASRRLRDIIAGEIGEILRIKQAPE